ncbi:MAG: aminopeptidase P family N-terminal domain-containing protein [Alphaproteobacteria bacterium]|nr:aminopeptidase P family N-terminal domain-containing protein [Alphaproteobacteria bacterium]
MSDNINLLRAEMLKHKIDGFVVPHDDEFCNEFVPSFAERLAYITGFKGSAGIAVVLKEKASFFTDSRYTIQARNEVNSRDFEIYSITNDQLPTPTLKPVKWIEKNLPKGATLGIDPWLHTANGVQFIREAVEKAGGTLVFVDSNPLDAAWKDRPLAPITPVALYSLEFAGKSSEEKRNELSKILKSKGVDALAIIMSEEICWLLNIRGNDVPNTPLALSYAIAYKDGSVDWFIEPRKINEDVKKWIGSDVCLYDLSEFQNALTVLACQGSKIWVDTWKTPVKVQDIVTQNGGVIYADSSPLQLMKALKNDTEIKGTIDAHIRDGVALTRFIAVISEPDAAAKFDEISAADLLEKFRSEGKNFRGLSFKTISAAGGHGAIVHYSTSQESNMPLLFGPIYLVDSGAQYLDGTTDVTRTIAVDSKAITDEMRDHVTRVLKGHIQIATSVFSEGTMGDKLDPKAHVALKEIGLDYEHGTGHGVDIYLSVHAGNYSISPLPPSSSVTPSPSPSVSLQPGMIISNEPGYYKEGAYGIRIENLVVVADTGKKDKDGKALFGFKTLTMAPIDRNLIKKSLLDKDELKWLNDYHSEVRKTLLPLLEKVDSKAAAFLIEATEPV